VTSALPPEADILGLGIEVRYVPTADIGTNPVLLFALGRFLIEIAPLLSGDRLELAAVSSRKLGELRGAKFFGVVGLTFLKVRIVDEDAITHLKPGKSDAKVLFTRTSVSFDHCTTAITRH